MADGIVGLELLAVSRLVVALCEVHAGKLGEIFELVHQNIGTINLRSAHPPLIIPEFPLVPS
jgi:hypothetical protein